MHKKYCLVITDDFSRFTWVFFLATKDETHRILKSFITEIENLVEKKVKIIRCDNGIKFNRVMNEFCEVKGIKRSPALSFMRPFRCHVTILNTLDQLGKFDGKSNEGIFVGYSTTSKAFRVYNIRTRKVKENLHITFLENKPMIAGDRPEWLFDINALLKSMNYAPVPVDGYNKDKHGSSQESKSANQERPNAESGTKIVNTAGLVNTATPTYADYPNDPFMPDLEDAGSLMMFMMIEMRTLVDLPPGKRSIRAKWVYRNKRDQRGIVVRNKARLVAQGHRQEEGIDYDEVFSLVARIEAIRLFRAYASFMDFTVYQMDVKSAFLYDTIEKE
nr:hypothetical protein [Tanacetum cinerariifolium]